MEKNTQDELLAKKELEHKRKAREIASAKRQKMKSLGLKSINTWLGLEEIEFINKYRDRYALPTLSDALYEIVKQAAIDDTKHRVYLDDLSKK
ncbi:hypothetical protein [Bartonella choladocola]|uniref:Uncharacterized protein n=2 Tax=Bartonella choladocola TaxID=2750995 RepID=A0A1U9MJ73_9HYPH|nr:hypothetical protein [Bartonella choladocola]AQT48007.1 hypothetical protein BBC0122_019130 [Bartonella choladocola]